MQGLFAYPSQQDWYFLSPVKLLARLSDYFWLGSCYSAYLNLDRVHIAPSA